MLLFVSSTQVLDKISVTQDQLYKDRQARLQVTTSD